MARLKVVSSKPCFMNGHLYEPGQSFLLPEGLQPSGDMEVIGEEEAPKPVKAKFVKEPEKELNTFSELNRAQAKAEDVAVKAKEAGPKGR